MAVKTEQQPGIETSQPLVIPQEIKAAIVVEPITDSSQAQTTSIEDSATEKAKYITNYYGRRIEVLPKPTPPIVKELNKANKRSGWVSVPLDYRDTEEGDNNQATRRIQVLVREGREIYEQCDQLFQGSPIFINPELYPKPVLVPNPEDPGKPILVFDRPANPNNPNSYFKVLINIENGDHYIMDESQIAMMRENKPQAPNRNGNLFRNVYEGVHEFKAFNAHANGHDTRNGQEINADQIKGQIKGRFVSTYLAQMTDDSTETSHDAIRVKRAWEIWKEELSVTAEDEVKEIIGQTTLKDCAEEVAVRHTNWRNTVNQSPEDESDWSESGWEINRETTKFVRAEKAFKEAAEL